MITICGSVLIIFLPFASLEDLRTEWDDETMKISYLMVYDIKSYQVTKKDIDWYRRKIENRVKWLYRIGIVGAISLFLFLGLTTGKIKSRTCGIFIFTLFYKEPFRVFQFIDRK
jgi:hypothetical protein